MVKEKCPDRILSNAIHGLVCGIVGGAIYVGASGVIKGDNAQKTISNLTRHAPMIAIQVCAITAVYSAIDCGLKVAREKDDFTNVVVSGAITGALFGAAHGPQASAVNCLLGAVIAALLDGDVLKRS